MAGSTHHQNYQQLLSLLRQARLRAHMTQEQLGNALGNSQTFVSKFERGERRIDVVEFVEICDAFGADPEEILRAYLVKRSIETPSKSRSRLGILRDKAR